MAPPRAHRLDLRAAAEIADETALDITFSELVKAHELTHPEKQLGPRLLKWVAAFGDLNAWAITPAQLHKASREMVRQGYVGGTANRDIGAIGQVYAWAVKRQRIAPSGFVSPTLSIPRHAETIRRVYISDDELAKLKFLARTSFRDRRFGLFVAMLADSGARKSEVLERTWSELDIEGRRVTLETTKNGDARTLFFSQETMDLAAKLKSKGKATGLIFEGRCGTPVNYRKPWAALTKMIARPELHLHDLRHGFAASLLAQGVTIGVAAQLLGHRDQTMLLRRYGHLETGHLEKVMDARFSTL